MAEIHTWHDLFETLDELERSPHDAVVEAARELRLKYEQITLTPEDLKHEIEAELVPFVRHDIATVLTLAGDHIFS